MLQHDFDASVGHWICTTSHAMRRALNNELVRENITMRQFEVLARLAFEGEQTQVELAEKLGIEAPTLAGVLSRMERDGWLERYPCSQDRRRKRIRVTERAETVWSRMVECCSRVSAQAVDGIPEEDLQVFKRTCERIRENIGICAGPLGACEVELETAAAID